MYLGQILIQIGGEALRARVKGGVGRRGPYLFSTSKPRVLAPGRG